MTAQRSNALEHLEKRFFGTIALLAFCTSAGIVLMEVAARYIFGHSFMWAHETAIYLAAAAAFLYFGIAQRESGHLTVNILPMVIGNRRVQRLLHFLASMVSIVYCLFFALLTLKLAHMFYSNNVKSINAELPVWIFYSCLFLGFVLLIVAISQGLFLPPKKMFSK